MKNIVFDIGMVLVDFHWAKTMRDLGIPEEAIIHFDKHMINHPLWRHLDLNDIPEEDIIAEFKKISPEYAEYIDLFFNNMEEVITMFPGTDTYMKSLKDRGYKVYLLSNYPKRMFEMHLKRYHFLPYVDGRVVSYEYQITKPNPDIYKALSNKYNLEPEETIFLDDRLENVEAAKALGWSGIHVTDPYEARNILDEILGGN